MSSTDAAFMRHAIALSRRGMEGGAGGPFGAVVVKDGQVVAEGWNQVTSTNDPTAHAEIRALRDAASRMGNYRLPAAALYVTLEPCVMCAGAIMHARVARVVFGASDPKTGACGSVIDLFAEARLNHHAVVTGGVLAEACAAQLQSFFRERRRRSAA
jgi:tRNA(adenine34) deaminase